MDIEDIKKFKEICEKQPVPSPKVVDSGGREVEQGGKQALNLFDVIKCPKCGGENIEDPHYNDYYCTDCHHPFD